jgi:hypothetical protein
LQLVLTLREVRVDAHAAGVMAGRVMVATGSSVLVLVGGEGSCERMAAPRMVEGVGGGERAGCVWVVIDGKVKLSAGTATAGVTVGNAEPEAEVGGDRVMGVATLEVAATFAVEVVPLACVSDVVARFVPAVAALASVGKRRSECSELASVDEIEAGAAVSGV